MINAAQTPASACPEIPANEPKHTGKSLLKQRAGRAGWTPARRRAQSARLMAALARWPRPAGPRTAAGKNISRYNALKHGMRCAAHRALYHKIRAALRAQRLFLKMVKLMHLLCPVIASDQRERGHPAPVLDGFVGIASSS